MRTVTEINSHRANIGGMTGDGKMPVTLQLASMILFSGVCWLATSQRDHSNAFRISLIILENEKKCERHDDNVDDGKGSH